MGREHSGREWDYRRNRTVFGESSSEIPVDIFVKYVRSRVDELIAAHELRRLFCKSVRVQYYVNTK